MWLLASLKEADAFQRLVCPRSGKSTTRALLASKKQTPFSVWYEREARREDQAVQEPQRSRRLSASGIRQPCNAERRPGNLKEADAFQRLVCPSRAPPSGRCFAPQRSRRLSASGIG